MGAGLQLNVLLQSFRLLQKYFKFAFKLWLIMILRLIPDRHSGVYKSVDELFKKADESVSQVRDNLPNQSGLEGAFHFVDAGSPDSAHKVIVCLVYLINQF